MATTSVKPKLESFAKVAAYNPNQSASSTAIASSTSSFEMVDVPSTADTPFSAVTPASDPKAGLERPNRKGPSPSQDLQRINDAVKSLRVKDEVLSLTSKSSDDGGTHASTSESSSRRPPSLDGKSATSGTTFALDEKESLRPDDSASVMAAEEDDSLSAPGSSRVGSETGARAFRDQFHEISERMGYPTSRGAAPARGPAPTRQQLESNMTGLSSADEAVSQPVAPGASNPPGGAVPLGFTQSGPDEKLLEALESPKDRLFLLRLEQDVVEFVKDSKEPMLDLPPCNSFCRLLIHKLADYYYLTHFVDSTSSSVRIYRTPFCRLPPPLTGISNPPTSGNTPPPSAQAMKIMRRGMSEKDKEKLEEHPAGQGDDSSQPTSENGKDVVGEDGKSLLARDKSTMTREERENAYREARERIFKGFEESEGDEGNTMMEEGKEVSRSSSRSGKTKAAVKKGRTAKDDGFEARSQFAPYFPHNQYPVPPFPPPAPYGYGGEMNGANMGGHSPYNPGATPMMQPQPHSMSYPMPPNPFFGAAGPGSGQGMPPMPPGYGQHGHPQRPGNFSPMNGQPWPSMVSGSYPAGYGPHPPQPPQQGDGQWSRPGLQYPGSAPTGGPHPHMPGMPPDRQAISPPGHGMGNPYPYGQLPSQAYPSHNQRNHQHPIPGSFNRNAFNPQTQAFVPGEGPFGHPVPYGPQHAAMNSAPNPSGQYGHLQAPFRMPLQGLNHSNGSNFPSPSLSHAESSKHSPNLPSAGGSPYSHHSPNTKPQPQSQQQAPTQSSLSKWGTPSNLPPKPPAPNPSSQPSVRENQHSLPSQVYTAAVEASLPTNAGANPGMSTAMPLQLNGT